MLEYDRLLDVWLDDDGVYDGLVEVDVDTGEVKKISETKTKTNEEKLPIELQQEQAVIVQNQIIELKQQLKLAEERQKEINNGLLKGMQENSIEQLQLDNMTITRKHESVQYRLDVERLKKEMPELVEQYTKEVPISEHIEIRIKK